VTDRTDNNVVPSQALFANVPERVGLIELNHCVCPIFPGDELLILVKALLLRDKRRVEDRAMFNRWSRTFQNGCPLRRYRVLAAENGYDALRLIAQEELILLFAEL